MPSAPSPAGSSATSAPGSSSPRATPARSPPRCAACTTSRELRARLGAAAREAVKAYTHDAWAAGDVEGPAKRGSEPLLAWKAMVRLLMLSGLILLLAAPPASAQGVREKILRECQEGRITGDYTPKQLRDARNHIPTDIDEYSDCRDVLVAGRADRPRRGRRRGHQRARRRATRRRRAARSRRATRSRTPELSDARLNSDAQSVGEQSIIPGAAGFDAAAERHGLPTSVLVVLILLGLCAPVATYASVRRRVHRSPAALARGSARGRGRSPRSAVSARHRR